MATSEAELRKKKTCQKKLGERNRTASRFYSSSIQPVSSFQQGDLNFDGYSY